MPTNITDVNTFSATVAAPSDGEAANSASLIAMVQTLANRTLNNKNRIDILEGDAAAHDVAVPMGLGVDASSLAGGVPAWFYAHVTPSNSWDTAIDQRTLTFTLNTVLRDGQSLTGFKVRFDPGAATQTSPNTMYAQLWYVDYDPTTMEKTATQLGSTIRATDSSAAAELRSTTFAAHTVSTLMREYTLIVVSSAAASSANDSIDAAAVTVANPTSP